MDLGPRATSFRQWSRALQAYAAAGALRRRGGRTGWRRARTASRRSPWTGAAGGAWPTRATWTSELDEEETRALLQEVPAAYRTQVNDVLLCALAEAVGGWTGGPRIRLALEGHGREEEIGDGVDLTRTVGWFTSLYPVVLDLAGAAGPGERLRAVKEQLRAVPARGIGLRRAALPAPDAEVRAALAALPEPEILFNYLGQLDPGTAPARRFRFAGGPRGAEVAAARTGAPTCWP